MGKINHKITSVQRVLINTVYENSDQVLIDTLLGKHGGADTFDGIQDTKERLYVERELVKQEALYTGLDFLTIHVCSWNLGGTKPLSKTIDLAKWLFPFAGSAQAALPDVIIVGFQEIVALNMTNVMMDKNSKQIAYWKDIIYDNLSQATEKLPNSEQYISLREENMVGLYISIWVKKCHQPHLKAV